MQVRMFILSSVAAAIYFLTHKLVSLSLLVAFCLISIFPCPWGLILVNVASSNLKCERKSCEYKNNNLFLGSRKIGFESFLHQECKCSFSNVHKVFSKGIKSRDLFPVSIFHLCSIAVRTVHLARNS